MPQELADLAAAYTAVSGEPCEADALVGQALAAVAREVDALPTLLLTDPVVRDTYLGQLLGFDACRALAAARRQGQPVALDGAHARAARASDPLPPRDALVYRLLGHGQAPAVLAWLAQRPSADAVPAGRGSPAPGRAARVIPPRLTPLRRRSPHCPRQASARP